jgi:recombinational DNA repair protein (RecF pathway)
LICRLLLRNGRKISAIFYGGQGGGKNQKGSLIEAGYMLKLELKRGSGKSEESVYSVKEFSPIWQHKKIRENFNAYYLLCFFVEITEKISQREDLKADFSMEDQSSKEIFTVLSNAIFQLEDSLQKNIFVQNCHLILFLGKIMMALGVFPEIQNCALCGDRIDANSLAYQLAPQHGGFICQSCTGDNQRFSIVGNQLVSSLQKISTLKYNEYQTLAVEQLAHVEVLISYICFQFGINKSSLNTLSFLISR